MTFNGIKGLWLVARHLPNMLQEGIIQELVLQFFQSTIGVDFKSPVRVANPDLGGCDGLSLLLGWPFVLKVRNHDWAIYAEMLTPSVHRID